MPRFKKALYSLKRPKYRPSWNKYNLYNMDRVKDPLNSSMTYFQQKWHSKALTRTYHGTTMRETDWRRIFRPDMRSVVSMDAKYLGSFDGSDLSAGRGAGRDTRSARRQRPVPYMNMIYHQLERRLDVAIWRALFASSVDQARQFVLHGGVKVNGRKMPYPGYLLNPGDLFQVEVERVMFAVGDRKSYWECRFGRQDRKRGYGKARRNKASATDEEDADFAEEVDGESGSMTADTVEVNSEDAPVKNQSKNQLRDLLSQARSMIGDSKGKDESAARKRSIRDFARTVRKELGDKAAWNTPINEQITTLAASLDLDVDEQSSKEAATANSNPISDKNNSIPMTKTLEADEERLLTAALRQFKENPIDYTKGYRTPWSPRPWMSPFAFIPRYLEVHAPICAAVYLRHPVAKSGLAEVPTPYGQRHNGLAFNWYLRRR